MSALSSEFRVTRYSPGTHRTPEPITRIAPGQRCRGSSLQSIVSVLHIHTVFPQGAALMGLGILGTWVGPKLGSQTSITSSRISSPTCWPHGPLPLRPWHERRSRNLLRCRPIRSGAAYHPTTVIGGLGQDVWQVGLLVLRTHLQHRTGPWRQRLGHQCCRLSVLHFHSLSLRGAALTGFGILGSVGTVTGVAPKIRQSDQQHNFPPSRPMRSLCC
jgi:hypothetical protein